MAVSIGEAAAIPRYRRFRQTSALATTKTATSSPSGTHQIWSLCVLMTRTSTTFFFGGCEQQVIGGGSNFSTRYSIHTATLLGLSKPINKITAEYYVSKGDASCIFPTPTASNHCGRTFASGRKQGLEVRITFDPSHSSIHTQPRPYSNQRDGSSNIFGYLVRRIV